MQKAKHKLQKQVEKEGKEPQQQHEMVQKGKPRPLKQVEKEAIVTVNKNRRGAKKGEPKEKELPAPLKENSTVNKKVSQPKQPSKSDNLRNKRNREDDIVSLCDSSEHESPAPYTATRLRSTVHGSPSNRAAAAKKRKPSRNDSNDSIKQLDMNIEGEIVDLVSVVYTFL